MKNKITAATIFRIIFLFVLVASLFVVPGEYAAFLAMLYVWLLFADQEGHLLVGTLAFALGLVVFVLFDASLLGFVLGITPIIAVSWLYPSAERKGTGGWVTNKGGMGAFYDPDMDPVDAARAQRRRDTNRTIRWNIWS